MSRRYVRQNPDPDPEPTTDQPSRLGNYGWGRNIAAVGVVMALVLDVGYVAWTLGRAEPEPSSVQVIQVYAEACFFAIVAIGIGIAIYIGSRAGE